MADCNFRPPIGMRFSTLKASPASRMVSSPAWLMKKMRPSAPVGEVSILALPPTSSFQMTLPVLGSMQTMTFLTPSRT